MSTAPNAAPAPRNKPVLEEEILLAKVRTDGGTQHRAFTDDETVQRYKDDMINGCLFPPIDVFFDSKHYWLADGFHRVLAAHELAMKSFPARIHRGSLRDAILYAVGSNAHHGKPRTIADKRRCVQVLLLDEEWKDRTDQWVADMARVSPQLVYTMRRELKIDKPAIRRMRNGKLIDTTKSGKHQKKGQPKYATKAQIEAMQPITPPPPAEPEHASYLVVRNQVERLTPEDLLRMRDHIVSLLATLGAA